MTPHRIEGLTILPSVSLPIENPTRPAEYNYDEKNSCVKGLSPWGDHGLHVAGTIGAVGNDGVGTSGIPVRFLAPPEILHLTLRCNK